MARRTKSELKDLAQFTFKGADGKDQNLKEFFEPDDFYEKVAGKDKKVVGIFVKHAACQRLAAAAGITMGTVQMLVEPNGGNEQQHLFAADFSYNGTSIAEVGEASTRNTSPGISRNYMGTMGFKRLFDRGVLNVLGFYELYSQEEADDLNEETLNLKISSKELEAIGPYIDGIVKAKTVDDLDKAMSKAVADRKAGKVTISDAQRNYLRTIYQTNRFDLELTAEDRQLQGEKPQTTPVAAPPVSENPAVAAKVAAAQKKLEQSAQGAEAKVAAPMTEEERAAAVARGDIPF